MKTKAGKRALEDREPKLVENTKQHLYCFGTTNTSKLRDLCTDLVRTCLGHLFMYMRDIFYTLFEC